ncbi:hypothetical protein J6590_081077 [Homalodisca vitripennis]|nr:hypothetical protein J6590_081077 [Homalodisca vitripennis]
MEDDRWWAIVSGQRVYIVVSKHAALSVYRGHRNVRKVQHLRLTDDVDRYRDKNTEITYFQLVEQDKSSKR